MAVISELDILLRAKVDKLPTDFKTGKDTAAKFKNEIEAMNSGGGGLATMFTGALPVAAAVGASTLVIKEGIDLAVHSATKFAEAVHSTMLEIDATSDQSKRLGADFGELVLLRKSIGDTSGMESDAVDASLQRMQMNLYEAASGTGELHDMLAALGVDAGELINQGPRAQLEALSEAAQRAKNPADQLKLAYEAFGKQGAGMVESLREGKGAIDDMDSHLERVGMKLENYQAEQVGSAMDAWGRVGDVATGVLMQISSEISPHITVFGDEAYRASTALVKWDAPVSNTVDFLVSAVFKLEEVTRGARDFGTQIAKWVPYSAPFFKGLEHAANTLQGLQIVSKLGTRIESEYGNKHFDNVDKQREEDRQKAEARKLAIADQKAMLAIEREKLVESQRAKMIEDKLAKMHEEVELLDEIANLRDAGLKPELASSMAKDIMEARKAAADGMNQGQLSELQQLQDARRQYQEEQKAADRARTIKDGLKTPEEKNNEQLAEYRDLYRQGHLGLEDFRKSVGAIAEKIVPAKTEQSLLSAKTAEGWKFMNQGRSEARQRELAEAMKQTAIAEQALKLQEEAVQAFRGVQTIGRAR